MKKENPTTILIVAGIVILAAIGAHYAGLFAVTGGSDSVSDYLERDITLGLESTCAYYAVTVNEFSLNGDKVFVTLDQNGWVQSWIFEVGDSETFEPDGCDELWTILCKSIIVYDEYDPATCAHFFITYEPIPIPCPPPTVTFLNDPKILFNGTTATCRVKIDAGAGHTLDRGLSQSVGLNGINWAELDQQIDYMVRNQTVNLTWEMLKSTNAVQCKIWAANDCGVSSGWVVTPYHAYPAPTITYLDDPEITFDGTTAKCRVKIDAGDGWVLKYPDTTVKAWNGNDWVNGMSNQLSYTVRNQTVTLTWNMVQSTNVTRCAIWADNTYGGQTGWVNTTNYTYPPSTPIIPCDGLPVCDETIHMQDRCCDGDPWSCRFIDIGGGVWDYRWEKWDTCGTDEICTCTGTDCVCVPIIGAKIDDTTDTLTTDKLSYSPSDTVYMTATGTNIGDATWNGRVVFALIDPTGDEVDSVISTNIIVSAGTAREVHNNLALSYRASPGIWTLKSTWIDDDGIIHARAITTLGSGESDPDPMYIVIGVLLFIIIVYAALKRRS